MKWLYSAENMFSLAFGYCFAHYNGGRQKQRQGPPFSASMFTRIFSALLLRLMKHMEGSNRYEYQMLRTPNPTSNVKASK